jgi:hypothetical protein
MLPSSNGIGQRSSKARIRVQFSAGVPMPSSFNGRTKVFEAFYVGSIPALGTAGEV